MRQLIRRLLAFGMMCLALPSMAGALWLSDATHLYVIDTGTQQVSRIAASGKVKAIAPTADGRAYVLTDHQLLQFDAKGVSQSAIALATFDAADIALLVADPFDATLWVLDNRAQIHHLNPRGQEMVAITPEAAPRAIALGQDQSLWVLGDSRLWKYSANGELSQTIELAAWFSGAPARLLVDSLNGGLWIGNAAQVWHFDLADPTKAPEVRWAASNIRDFSLEPKLGTLWTLTDVSLQAYDSAGAAGQRIDLAALGIENVSAVAGEPGDASLWVTGSRGLVHLSSAGARLPAPVFTALPTRLAAVPFWIAPRLQLLTPSESAVLNNPRPTFTLGIEDLCSGVPCNFLPTILPRYSFLATLDQQEIGQKVRFDQKTGKATFTPTEALANGIHDFSAVVIDRFGHASQRVHAGFEILAANQPGANRLSQPLTAATMTALSASKVPTALTSTPSTSTIQTETVMSMAAAKNQPPSATLTTNGTNFSSGASIPLNATAVDVDGTITGVKFYRGGTTLIGSGTFASNQWTYTWTNVPIGNYAVTAVATDNAAATGTSNTVNLSVTTSSNSAPTVTITTPVSGAALLVPANGTIAARAIDSDGTIIKVDFYDGPTLLGTVNGNGTGLLDATQAFSNLTRGAHVLTVTTTDNAGATSSSAVNITVSVPPIVALINPSDCSLLPSPSNVSLRAHAISPDGGISKVEFYNGTTLIGVAPYFQNYGSAIYSIVWNGVTGGTYTVTAKAYDKRGNVTTSAPMTVRVNAAPTVSFITPVPGATYKVGSPVALEASASDGDGSVASVSFMLANYVDVGYATKPPFTATWIPSSSDVGARQIIATARDNTGLTGEGRVTVNIIADLPPKVDLTAPLIGGTYHAGMSIALSAAATAGDYLIQRIEFYRDGALIGSSLAAPYSFTWPNVAAGTYAITARAITQGSSTTSAPVTITVAAGPAVDLTGPVNGARYFAPADITLSANASEPGHTIASVAFYQGGTLLGSATAAPFTITWKKAPAGTYSITAIATDEGGITSSSTPVAITVVAPTISITSPLAGAAITGDKVLVQGRIDAPPYSGVTVNGVIAVTDDNGNFYANDVQLAGGVNTLTATVTTLDEATGSDNVSVTAHDADGSRVIISETEGVATLPTHFTVNNENGIRQVDLDFHGTGTVNYSTTSEPNFAPGQTSFGVSLTYSALGVHQPVVIVTDMQGNVSRHPFVVRVNDPAILQQMFGSLWGRMLDNLKKGEVDTALTAVTASMRDRFRNVFTSTPDLSTVVDQLGTLASPSLNMKLTEYLILRNTPDGTTAFPLYFIRCEDGVWRIDGM